MRDACCAAALIAYPASIAICVCDFFTGAFTSNADLETGARNDIKNKAMSLGGDTVYILTQRAGQTGSYNDDFGGGSQQTNVTLSGNVYKCRN